MTFEIVLYYINLNILIITLANMSSTQTPTKPAPSTTNNNIKAHTRINPIKTLIQHELQNKVITNLLNT